jgi:hypothetical protein
MGGGGGRTILRSMYLKKNKLKLFIFLDLALNLLPHVILELKFEVCLFWQSYRNPQIGYETNNSIKSNLSCELSKTELWKA